MITTLLALSLSTATAHEGMWTPQQLAAGGLSLGEGVSMDELTAPGGALAAVVSLGDCSGALVSAEGLVLTNQHCAQRFLQLASGDGTDLLAGGLAPRARADEVPAGSSARLWLCAGDEDVTARVLDGVRGLDDAARWHHIERVSKELVAGCEAAGGLRCEVVPYYGGASYQLVRQRELRDVRLVYAPPYSIAQFGGDTDNWMWPRHALDFALLRVYVDGGGRGAGYAPDNVPLHPDAWLRIAADGVGEGDRVMMAGFPGRTLRHRTASEAKHAALVRYPLGVALHDEALAVLEAHMERSRLASSKLQTTSLRLANVRKSYVGMIEAFDRGRVASQGAAEEAAMEEWVSYKRRGRREWAEVLVDMRREVDAYQTTYARNRTVQFYQSLPGMLSSARDAYRLAAEREREDVERLEGFQARDAERLKAQAAELDAILYLPAERDLLTLLLRRLDALPADQRVPQVDAWIAAQGGVEEGVIRLFEDPWLRETDRRLALYDTDRAALEAMEDPWMQLAVGLERWWGEQLAAEQAWRGAMSRLRPLYLELQAKAGTGARYPDANGTLRVSVGEVQGYSPAEAVRYAPQTTLAGMLAKRGEVPFALSEEQVGALRAGAESRWSDGALGSVPLNFLSTLDSTGGSSGSPTLNAAGELVGVVFDRNYEGMAADWRFQEDATRSIHLDIRAALWALGQEPGGAALLSELGVGGE
ncbi:MAG: S46 family peptidase [Deltaproteobacteria bacterium]|nr:S46 family peptidase [Deltaproteobacteria bacterium]